MAETGAPGPAGDARGPRWPWRRRQQSPPVTPAGGDEVPTLLAAALNEVFPGWNAEGNHVRGPGTLALLLQDHPRLPVPPNAAHIDVGFALNVEREDAPVLWDCSSGFGTDPAQARARAVRAWAETTAPVVLELLTHRGDFAEHYGSDHPQGLPGRHTIHGAILGWGIEAKPDELQAWWLDHPLLPVLGRALEPALNSRIHGVRIFFGSSDGQDTAEVLVDGSPVRAAQDLLLGLDWPRSDGPAYVRSYLLVLAEDGATSGA